MILPLLLLGCTYTVADWFDDIADGYCSCHEPETYDACMERQLSGYEDDWDFWGVCADDDAPVERGDVRAWYREYEDTCDFPSADEPSAEDPYWFESCEA